MYIITAGMTEFILVAAIVALIIFGWKLFSDDGTAMAIKLRKDGKYEYERMASNDEGDFPLWLKISIFIIIASVLFIPLDFILNRP